MPSGANADQRARSRARASGTSRARARATQTQIYAPGFRSLAEGEPVEFKRMEFNGRIQASDVTGPDGSYVQGTLPPSQDANKDDF